MKKLVLGLSLASVLIWAAQGEAIPIGPGAFSGNETVIDFDSVPVSVPPPGPFSIGPVTFSESSTGSGGPGWRLLSGFFVPGSRALTDNAGISNIVIDFMNPVQRVGLDVGVGPATYDVRFFSSSLTLLGTVSQSLPNNNRAFFFAGWEDLGGISRIQILEPSGEERHGRGPRQCSVRRSAGPA